MESSSMIGADGSVFAIRRSLHQPPPDHIIDDLYVSLKILCSGFRVIQASDAVAPAKWVVVGREEFRRKIRMACQAFNVLPALAQLHGIDEDHAMTVSPEVIMVCLRRLAAPWHWRRLRQMPAAARRLLRRLMSAVSIRPFAQLQGVLPR